RAGPPARCAAGAARPARPPVPRHVRPLPRATSRCAMPRRDPAATTPSRRAGFATAVVLGLVAVIGLLSVGALHDALFGEQLAASRMLHQRAAVLADLGILEGMTRLGASDSPPTGLSFAIQAMSPSGDSTSVRLRQLASTELPAGSSAVRLAAHHCEIESTGHTARGVRMTQVQGAMRVMPVIAPAAWEAEVHSGTQGAQQ